MKKNKAIFITLLSMVFIFGCQMEENQPDLDYLLNDVTLEKYYIPYDATPTAAEVAKAMGLGENLGNTMEAYNATNCDKASYKWIPKVGRNTPGDYERNWGAVTTTQKVIAGMKAEGFDTVRIPVFMGETSVNYPKERFAADAPNKDSTACVEYVMKKLIDCGFVPVLWDVNDNFYSRTEYKIKNDKDREMIKNLKASLK